MRTPTSCGRATRCATASRRTRPSTTPFPSRSRRASPCSARSSARRPSCSSGRRSRRVRLRGRRSRAGAPARAAPRPRPSPRSSRCACPVLWRGGPLGDSNVPYAALVVGAAAAGIGTPACAGLLTVAGTLRPEAWGLAVINAVLGWRMATLRDARALARLGDRSAGALDDARPRLHGRLVVVEQHRRRLQRPLPPAAAPPLRSARSGRRARRRRRDLAGRAAGARRARRRPRRRPYDAGVVFPIALVLALALVVARGQISADDVGRMLTALAVFAAAGAAVALAAHAPACCAARWPSSRSRRCRSRPRPGWRAPCTTWATRRARRGRSRTSSRPRSSASRRRVRRAPAPVAGPAGALLGPARGARSSRRARSTRARVRQVQRGRADRALGRQAAALDPPGRRSRTTGAPACARGLHQLSLREALCTLPG